MEDLDAFYVVASNVAIALMLELVRFCFEGAQAKKFGVPPAIVDKIRCL